MSKRAFDILAAAIGLLFAAPLLILLALAVKLHDGGSAFYCQKRVGRRGKPFNILKFRTMCIGADKMGPSITKDGDARITIIGRLLRKTKMDELPQLYNVLIGEMSLVGPRPEVPRYVALYTADQARVLELRPGITDLATLTFRDEEELLAKVPDPERYYREYCMPRKIELNLRYAAHVSVFSDIKMILLTLAAIVRRTGMGTEKVTPPGTLEAVHNQDHAYVFGQRN